jgi:copper resistance protein D
MLHLRNWAKKIFRIQFVIAAAALLFSVPQWAAGAPDEAHAMHHHAGMPMAADNSIDAVMRAKLLADKAESEFNHHLAGLLVVLAGLLILAESNVRERWPAVRHVWPFCFLVSGLFVLVFSDTELWPFGAQSWHFGLTQHAEVLQHKLFAVLLVAVGLIELQRTRGVLKAAWATWVFPALAVMGSLMLFFHDHQGSMHTANQMALMERIQSQHVSFAVTGFGIALSKGLAETRFGWRQFFERLFPTLLVVLGSLLLVYVE